MGAFFVALLGTNSSGNLTVMVKSSVTVKILRIMLSLSFFFFLVVGMIFLAAGGARRILEEKRNIYLGHLEAKKEFST